MKEYKLNKHLLGYYHICPLPDEEALVSYYRDKYFQACKSCTYEPEYAEEEITYFKNQADITEKIWRDISGEQRTGSVLDVGCGEGFFIQQFLELSWKVQACDYSDFGLKKQNPSVLPYFMQGDIYSICTQLKERGMKYDLLSFTNVLEHVREPMDILEKLKTLMGKHSILRIVVPNDFSDFQEFLIQKACLEEQTWLCPPDHLNYFTFHSLRSFLEAAGFNVVKMLTDFPIELFLLNEHSNYWKDRSKGKQAHLARTNTHKFLYQKSLEDYISYYEAAAKLEFGRSVIAFATIR